MAKRAKTSSSRAKKLKACPERELLEDRISELPDVILVSILSLLTMKEAGQTCVLSKRWRHVWAYIPVLDFDGSNTTDNIFLGKELFHVEKRRFLHWVNQVVESYRGPTITEFRVRFDLSVTSRFTIDNWVKFVMEKRVKRLELDFDPDHRSLYCKYYTFRCSLISNLLTSLKLAYVNVTNKILQNFLKNCPNLEYLLVSDSKSLVNLEVTGEALNLKYLELHHCRVRHIEISAPNLISFSYFGRKIDVPLKNAPKLSKLSAGGHWGKYLISNSLEFSSCLFQLEAFRLDIKYALIENVMTSTDQFTVCTRLKQLEVVVKPTMEVDLVRFAKMLKACPFLHNFVLTLDWGSFNETEWFEAEACEFFDLNISEVETRPHYHVNALEMEMCPYWRVQQLQGEVCPHYHLKTVEIVGFVGHSIELEFIIYLKESCFALEKLAIDPRDHSLFTLPPEWRTEAEDVERETTARKKAEQLSPMFKSGTELIIL